MNECFVIFCCTMEIFANFSIFWFLSHFWFFLVFGVFWWNENFFQHPIHYNSNFLLNITHFVLHEKSVKYLQILNLLMMYDSIWGQDGKLLTEFLGVCRVTEKRYNFSPFRNILDYLSRLGSLIFVSFSLRILFLDV